MRDRVGGGAFCIFGGEHGGTDYGEYFWGLLLGGIPLSIIIYFLHATKSSIFRSGLLLYCVSLFTCILHYM